MSFEHWPKPVFLCVPAASASLFWPANPCLSWRQVHKRWICSSTRPRLFIYRTDGSILPSASPARHSNPARTNREIKKLKMRRDERQGHGVRQDVARWRDGRCLGRWRADVQVGGGLISTGPLLHFLEHDAVFCGGKVRLSATPAVYPASWATYVSPSLSSVLKGETHPRAPDLVSM